MALSTAAEPVPFTIDPYGVARVGGTRVPLEVIVGRYRMGDTVEDLHRGFPTVTLADIHHVIAYSLRHKDEVDEYMRQTAEQSRESMDRAKARGIYQDYDELRERLNSRTSK